MLKWIYAVILVNIFDLTLYPNRFTNNFKLQYLIHDGSYCKPDDLFTKGRLIRYIDKILTPMVNAV